MRTQFADRGAQRDADLGNDVRQLESSLTREFYSSCGGRYKLGIPWALVLSVALWEVVPHDRILAWFIAVTVSQISSQALCAVFRRTSTIGKVGVYWKRSLAASIAIDSLAAGSAGFFLFPVGSLPHQFILALFLCCIGGVAAITYAAHLSGSIISIFLITLPLSGVFFREGSEFSVTMGAVLLLFAVTLVGASVHMNRVLLESLRLRFEKDDLIESLSKEKEKVEVLNGELEAEVLERKLVAESLARSEERYRAVVQSQTELVCRLRSDYRLSFVNDAFGRYFGREPSDLMGESFLQFVYSEDLHRVKEYFAAVAGGDFRGPHEHRVHRADGQIDWIQWVHQPICGDQGQVKEYQGVGRDITAQKRAEEALEASERRFRTLVETAKDVIWTMSLDFRLTYISPSVKGLLGFDPEEIMGMNPMDTLTARSKERMMEIFRTEMAWEQDGSASAFAAETAEFEQYRKDGSVVSVEMTVKLLRDRQEAPVALFGTSRDITERKKAQDALKRSYAELERLVTERTTQLRDTIEKLKLEIAERHQAERSLQESEQRFRTIFEKARDSIFVKDRQLRYTHLNPAMQSIIEADEWTATGLTDAELYGREQAARLETEDLRVLSGQVIEAEHTLRLHDREITFDCVKIPMTDANGDIVGLCGIARDVTERARTQIKRNEGGQEFKSPPMLRALHQAQLAARSESLVLLLGESGSGKDYLASHIHRMSQRAGGPFFSINCAALARELAESELFGHEAGSFTGARTRKRGMLELAEGGTLLLNEIGELSLGLQAKLLTFLDTRSFTRVGGEANVEVSARLIAATNRDLRTAVKDGHFREDLFYRLNVFSIHVPPLRDRLEDLPHLIDSILKSLCAKLGCGEPPRMDSRCLPLMTKYHWPGNVRELKNVLERALILSEGGKIKPEAIRLWQPSESHRPEDDWEFVVRFPDANQNLKDVSRNVKLELMKEALRRTSGVKQDAARLLGISVDSFKYQVKSVGV